jgi:hypothetical protein
MREGAWLVAFVLAQRLVELCFAQFNTSRLRAEGGIEFGAAHYPLMVALHASWLLGLWMLGRDRPIDEFWLVVFAFLQVGRVWVIASPGRRWNCLQEKAAGGRTGIVLGLAVLFAYVFLVALYESWNIPLSALLSVSVAILGQRSIPSSAGRCSASMAPCLSWCWQSSSAC